ncbi:hypothetical protein ACQU0X_26825 [Pseudovibrio ascidiaceicola]|uniref:hypothetical protein n=1 Tax=Pseudovibrio ascidiaceicola TaxID=285279 RepID=UPI003D35CD3F
MLYIIVVALIGLALLYGGGVALINFSNQGEKLASSQMNLQRIRVNVSSLENSILDLGDRFAIPLGPNTQDRGYLARSPNTIPYSKTPWGREYVYCPFFGPSLSSGDGVVENGTIDEIPSESVTERYNIRSIEKGGRQYLVAGSPLTGEVYDKASTSGVVAFLISPFRTSSGVIHCSNVKAGGDGTGYFVEGGFVYPVFKTEKPDEYQNFYLSTNGDDAEHTNERWLDVGSFDHLIAYVRQNSPNSISIHFPEGSEQTATLPELNELVSIADRVDLEFSAITGAKLMVTTTEQDGSEVGLKVSGVIRLKNIEIEAVEGSAQKDFGLLVAPGGVLDIENVKLGFIENVGGKIHVTGQTTIEPAYSSARLLQPFVQQAGETVLNFAPGGSGSNFYAPTAQELIVVKGGSVTALSAFSARVGDATIPVAVAPGASFIAASGADALIDRGEGGVVTPLKQGSPVVKGEIGTQCDDGSLRCEAVCTEPTVAISGTCDADEGVLAGFGWLPGRAGWFCDWSAAHVVARPEVKALCVSEPELTQ